MEVADTEAAVILVGATSAAATSAAVTSPEVGPMCTLAGAMCTLVGPMCTLAGPASPEAATSGMTEAVGIAAVGLAAGVMGAMVPATRTGAFIRTATGRSELKPMGVLNVHWRRKKARACSLPPLADDGRAFCVALRDHPERICSG
jgi:hypothetical protein